VAALIFRKAHPEEFDEIYRMGFDVWGEAQALEIYLERDRGFQPPGYF
jgi:hypothetical protein